MLNLSIVCKYTSVNLCFSLCVFVYAILACIRWFIVLNMWCVYMCVPDVKICVHMHGV